MHFGKPILKLNLYSIRLLYSFCNHVFKIMVENKKKSKLSFRKIKHHVLDHIVTFNDDTQRKKVKSRENKLLWQE